MSWCKLTALIEPTNAHAPARIPPTLQEWLKDHRLAVATLEELAGQLAVLQPPQTSSSQPPRPAAGGSGSSGSGDERKELLARLMERAPSERLRSYIEGRLPAARLQRTLPEQLDENMRLLSILAAEMRALAQRLEQLADEAAAAAAQGGGTPSDDANAGAADSAAAAGGEAAIAAHHGQSSSAAAAGAPCTETALLLAAVADGAAKETLLIVSSAAVQGVAKHGAMHSAIMLALH